MSRDLTLATMTFLRSNLKPEVRLRYLQFRADYYHHAPVVDIDIRDKRTKAYLDYAQKQFALSKELFFEYLKRYENKDVAVSYMIHDALIPPQFTGYTQCSKCSWAPSRDICAVSDSLCDFCK